MISWRYHLVSIVAIIIALALGVLAGATVIGDRFVVQLQRNTRDAERRADQYYTELTRLQGVVGAAGPFLLQGRLAGQRVVLVTQDPVDLSVLNQVRRSIEGGAGGDVVAELVASPNIVNPDRQTQLAELVGRQTTDVTRLPALFASVVADRLEFGPGRGTDVLDRASALVSVDPAGVDLSQVGGPGTIVVVFAGGTSRPALDPASFLLPLVEALAKQASAPVAVGEPLTSDWGFVKAVRGDGDSIAKGSIVTVDDLDQSYGGMALVLGLWEMLTTPDGGGDYGVSGNGLLPAPPPSP